MNECTEHRSHKRTYLVQCRVPRQPSGLATLVVLETVSSRLRHQLAFYIHTTQ